MSISSLIQFLEYLAMFLGVIGVWLTTKENKWNWVISTFSVGIYIFIFYHHKLYADSGLNVLYVFLSIYGWYKWQYPDNNAKELLISRINFKTILISITSFLFLSISIWYYLKHFTDSEIPIPDAVSTAASLVCTWLMAKKILENWIFWIVIDAFYVGLYLYRDLYPTAILFTIFVILSVKGFVEWKKTIILQQNA